MFDMAHRRVSAFRWWVRDRRYRAGYRLAQWRRAWRYAIDGLSVTMRSA